MDPLSAFGVATGVIGLVPLCAQGFNMIKDCFEAPGNVQKSMTQILIQRIVFLSWADPLGLLTDGERTLSEQDEKRAVEALKRAIPSWHLVGDSVLDVLAAMSDTFADAETLEKTYGLGLSKRNQTPSLGELYRLKRQGIWRDKSKFEERRKRMTVLRRCTFVLSGKDEFAELAKVLDSFNDGLMKVCRPPVVQTIYNIVIPEMLSDANTSRDPATQPAAIAEAARELAIQARGRDQEQQFGYELLASAASFRGKVQNIDAAPLVLLERRDHEIRSAGWAIMDGDYKLGTMALRQSKTDQSQVHPCYVEWKSYLGNTPQQSKELENRVLKLGKIATLPGKPPEFRVLDCLGVFKDPAKYRYGFVYILPRHLWTMDAASVADRSIYPRRAPTPLLSVITGQGQGREWEIPPEFDLGSRIGLAKKLAQGLLMLHAAGWVHKNICSRSIVFFRDCSGVSLGPSTSGRLDYAHPYICGFGQARPDYTVVAAPSQIPAVPQGQDRDKSYAPGTRSEQRRVMKNLYQHPAKRLDPEIYYHPNYDLYSLGCIMLEIALWQPISDFKGAEGEDPNEFRKRLLGLTRREMPEQIGRIYSEATRMCLEAEAVRASDRGKGQMKDLCWKVIQELGKCVV